MAPPQTPPDAGLLARLRAGEDAAWEQLVRAETPKLLRVVRRIVGGEDEARDMLQESFVTAFRALPAFDGRSRVSTWLYRIAVNAALMRLRRRKHLAECSVDELLPGFLEDGHRRDPGPAWRSTPEEDVERARLQSLVRERIAELPETHREALLLYDIQGLETAEVAQALGVSVGALKTRVHRARQALRALLDPAMREPA
jgi:RNA polymerase sigma-70 factor, ECF subfamily